LLEFDIEQIQMQYLVKRRASDIVVPLHREILAVTIDDVVIVIAEENILCLIFIMNYKTAFLQLFNLLLNRFERLQKNTPSVMERVFSRTVPRRDKQHYSCSPLYIEPFQLSSDFTYSGCRL